MLIFIDESGDPGLKFEKGSSPYFCVVLVVFEDHDEALACDQRIELLKREISKPASWEFHFKDNKNSIKRAFLQAVAPYNFFYYAIVLNKKKLWGEGFRDKDSFYKYACSLVFENAKGKLDNSIIVIDESGGLDFKMQLKKYLQRKVNGEIQRFQRIKKVKMQKSSSNNLLQLADYVAGVINRSASNMSDNREYRKLINHREIYVQIWPK